MKRILAAAALIAAGIFIGHAAQGDATPSDCLALYDSGVLVYGQASCAATTSTVAATSTTSTTAAPTTTAPATTTTVAATTTTVPGSSVMYTFDTANGSGRNGALPLTDWSVSRWRQESANPPIPNTQGYGPALPGDIRVIGGRLVIESGMQNYGDTQARLNRSFTGNRIEFDATLAHLNWGWGRLYFADQPGTGISYFGDNSSGLGPRNGFLLDFLGGYGACPLMRRYVNYIETDYTADGQPLGPYNCAGPWVDASPGVNHHVVITFGASVVVTIDGQESATFPASPIATGWVTLGMHNHASVKYTSVPTVSNTFDNVYLSAASSLDRVAQVLDSGTQTFGYPLTATMTNLPATTPLSLAGASQGWLAVDVATDPNPATNATSAVLSYRLNGGPVHQVPFIAGNRPIMANQSLSIPVNVAEFVNGANLIGFSVQIVNGGNMSVANVDLIVR